MQTPDLSDSPVDTPHRPNKTGARLFDALELARSTESVVCRGDKRKYYGFWVTPQNYTTGVATGYAVGCELRCVFCWANETRDHAEQGSEFYSPQEVFDRLAELVARNKGLHIVRISNGEPTIGKEHLLGLLELVERAPEMHEFALETNGILLGHDEDLVRALAQFKKLYVRLSVKAGTPEAFARKTGATAEGFELQFQGIRNLMAYKVRTGVAAMSADPRFMSPLERVSLIGKLASVDPALVLALEEEMTVLFPTTTKRLVADGWDYSNVRTSRILRHVPFLQKYVQYSYEPVRSLKRQKVSIRYTMKAIRELFYGI